MCGGRYMILCISLCVGGDVLEVKVVFKEIEIGF